MDVPVERTFQDNIGVACVKRRGFHCSTMKGTPGSWCLSAFLLQMAFILVCSNARQCTHKGRFFAVLGVFDGNDTASIRKFQSAVGDLDKLVNEEPGCTPKITHRELLLHEQMSATQVINATRNVFAGENICYVVYSSYGSNGQLLLDYALNSGIPVVSTIPNKVYSPVDDSWDYMYDQARVISLNERSTRSSKVKVTLDFLFTHNHKEFVAITGVDFDDMSVVSSLRQEVGQHNLVMVDWFIIPKDSDVLNRTREKMSSLESYVSCFLIITDDMLLARMVVNATKSTIRRRDLGPTYYEVILVTDLDYHIIEGTDFDMPMTIILPYIRQNLHNSDYMEDAIGLLNNHLEDWKIDLLGRCPSITDIQRHLPRLHTMYMISEKSAAYEAYTIDKGFFSSNGILDMKDTNQYPKLRFVLIEYAPYIMIQRKITPIEPCKSDALPCLQNGEEKCCNGFVIEVLKMIRDRLNFNSYLEVRGDGISGTQEKNGSWKGIVNDIIINEADMSPDLFPNSRRSEVLDFTDPYMPTGISLLVKETKRQQSKIYWTTYMRPFTSTLWYAFVGSVGVMVAFLWFVEKFSPSTTGRKLFHWKVAFCIDNAVCYVLQLAFGRPADETKPRTHGARLTGLIFGIAMLILMASYSANLAAFLIVADMTTPVDSISDPKFAYPPSGFKYGTLEGSYMDDFFKNNGKEDFRKIWHIMKKDNVKSLTEGVEKVLSGELKVFIGDTVSLKYAALNDSSCQLKVVGEPFAMSGASFAVKKGSRRLASFSTALRELKSQGLEDFIQKFWVKRFTCNKVTPPAQLHLEDLSGLFLQLLIIMVLCILGTSCHLVWIRVHTDYRKCERENKPVDIEDENDMSIIDTQDT